MRVLLVDDSDTMRRIQVNQLKQLGVQEIFQADNGKTGLETLEKNMPIDLVMLDQNMPIMDGLTCLKTIRANDAYKYVRVIMCTSESEKEMVFEAIKAGANDYIKKPFQGDALKKKVLVGA